MNSQLPLFIELQKYDLRLFEILDKKKKALALIKTAQGPVLEMSKQLKTVQEAGAVLERQRRNREQGYCQLKPNLASFLPRAHNLNPEQSKSYDMKNCLFIDQIFLS